MRCIRGISGHGAYLTGPLARYSLNSSLLSPLALEAAKQAGLGPTCNNPFRSIVIRAVEVVYAFDEALRIIDAYQEPDRSFVETPMRPGVGYACTEAPRGMLYHRYRLDAEGSVLDAKIVPPTSQNQPSIEDGPARFRAALARFAGREAGAFVRAGDPEPRPVHFLRDAFSEVGCRAGVTGPRPS